VVPRGESVKVTALVAAASGISSKISVDTIRSPATVSRHWPWNTTGKPPWAVTA
jgi:hypothetical protein